MKLSDLFVSIESVTPYEYKTKGVGININYGIHPTPFGLCLMANTSRGVCAVEFIDDNEDEVVQRLKQKWRNATIQEDRRGTYPLIESIFYNERI